MDFLAISERLIAFAIFFQSIEYFQIRSSWMESGVWRWSILKKDHLHFPAPFRKLLDAVMCDQSFTLLLVVRILAATLIFIFPYFSPLFAILFFSTWLIAIRWRGVFNGGSDSMTALISLSLWVAVMNREVLWITRACLGYIAVQLTASYFIAGLVKLKNPLWRDGRALGLFFETPSYDSPPEWIRKLLSQPLVAKTACLGVILFECSFPLAWMGLKPCVLYLSVAFVFHILNFWIFGLNRFVFAWVSAYPALIFWSQRV